MIKRIGGMRTLQGDLGPPIQGTQRTNERGFVSGTLKLHPNGRKSLSQFVTWEGDALPIYRLTCPRWDGLISP